MKMTIETLRASNPAFAGLEDSVLNAMLATMASVAAEAAEAASASSSLESPLLPRHWFGADWPSPSPSQQDEIAALNAEAGTTISLSLKSYPKARAIARELVEALAAHGHTDKTTNGRKALRVGGRQAPATKSAGRRAFVSPPITVPHGAELFAFVLLSTADPAKVKGVIDSLFSDKDKAVKADKSAGNALNNKADKSAGNALNNKADKSAGNARNNKADKSAGNARNNKA